MNDLPIARLDIIRYIWARTREKYGNSAIVRLVHSEDTPEQTITMEIFTHPKVHRFQIDDTDWQDPAVIVDHILAELDIQVRP